MSFNHARVFLLSVPPVSFKNMSKSLTTSPQSPRSKFKISPRGKYLQGKTKRNLTHSTRRPINFDDNEEDEDDDFEIMLHSTSSSSSSSSSPKSKEDFMEEEVEDLLGDLLDDVPLSLPKPMSILNYEHVPQKMPLVTIKKTNNVDYFSEFPDLEARINLDAYPKADFNTRNKFDMDDTLRFEAQPDHTYFINNNSNDIMSVTQYINTKIFNPFPEFTIANAIVRSQDYLSRQSPYSGMTVEEIMNQWETTRNKACLRGERIHRAIYNYFETQELYISPYLPQAFREFRKRYPTLRPVRTEHSIAHPLARICGSTDFLGEDESRPGEYILIDWKTNLERDLMNEQKHPSSKRWKRIHPFFEAMPDTPWTKDIVQLNFYAKIYREVYNIHVKRMFVLHIPSGDIRSKEYQLLPVQPCPYLDEIFEERIKHMQMLGY